MFHNKSTIAFVAIVLTTVFAFNSQAANGEKKRKKEVHHSSEHKAAYKACKAELGISESEKDREALKSCLQAKGITMSDKKERIQKKKMNR